MLIVEAAVHVDLTQLQPVDLMAVSALHSRGPLEHKLASPPLV